MAAATVGRIPVGASAGLLVFLLLSTGLPAGSGQGGTPIHSVSFTTVPQAVVRDLANSLTVTVRNEAASPGHANLRVFAFEGDEPRSQVFSAENQMLAAGERRAYSFQFNGRQGNTPDGPAFESSVTLQAEVSPVPSLGEPPATATVTRPIQYHELELVAQAPPGGVTMVRGGEWNTLVSVRNVGTADDSATLEVLQVTEGWNYELEVDSVELPQSAPEALVGVTLLAPQEAPAGEVGVLEIRTRSRTIAHVIANATVASPPVRAGGGLSISTSTPFLERERGEQAVFRVRVENRINREEPVEVTIEGLRDDVDLTWTVEPSGPTTIAAGASREFQLASVIPWDSLAGVSRWMATATSVNEPSFQAVLSEPLELVVRQDHDVDLTVLGDAPIKGEPGHEAIVKIRAANSGNGPDDLRVRPHALPQGWTMAAVAPFTVEAFADVTLDVRIAIPSGEPAGAGSARLVLESVADPQARDLATVTVDVPESARPIVQVDGPLRSVEKGATVSYNLTVANVGNTPSTYQVLHEFNLSQTSPPPSTWEVSTMPESFRLAPGETIELATELTAPQDLAPDDRAVLNISIASTADADWSGAVTVEAGPAFPDLTVTVLGTTPAQPYRNAEASLQFQVGNIGTASTDGGVAVRAVVRPQGASTILAQHEMSTSSLDWTGPAAFQNFEIALPTDRPALDVTLIADPQGTLPESNEENNEATTTIAFRRFDVTVAAPAARYAEPGEAVSLENDQAFRVRNNAGEPESVRINITSQPAWLAPSPRLESLPAQTTKRVPLVLHVPEEPEAESVRITLRVESSAMPNFTSQASTTIQVPDRRPPTIGAVEANVSRIHAGNPVSFTVQLKDSLGIRQARIHLVGPSGAVQTVELTAGAEGFTAEERLPTPGTYRYYAWAQDNAVARNTNDSALRSKELVVVPVGHPLIQFVQPAEGAAVRPGTNIVAHVSAPSPLRTARYTVGNVTLPLPAVSPLQVSTTGWPDGPAVVRVEVTDINDASDADQRRIRIDGTPPRLVRLTATPMAEAPGAPLARVEAALEDASKITKATLRLERRSLAALEVPMVGSGGEWVANANLSADVTRLVVVAEDEAGNRGIGEREVGTVLGAQGPPEARGFLSAPSLAAALLAMGLVGVHLRRRRIP